MLLNSFPSVKGITTSVFLSLEETFATLLILLGVLLLYSMLGTAIFEDSLDFRCVNTAFSTTQELSQFYQTYYSTPYFEPDINFDYCGKGCVYSRL